MVSNLLLRPYFSCLFVIPFYLLETKRSKITYFQSMGTGVWCIGRDYITLILHFILQRKVLTPLPHPISYTTAYSVHVPSVSVVFLQSHLNRYFRYLAHTAFTESRDSPLFAVRNQTCGGEICSRLGCCVVVFVFWLPNCVRRAQQSPAIHFTVTIIQHLDCYGSERLVY